MARPEKPIAYGAPFAGFAHQLRRLRHDAGSPTYAAMSRRIKRRFSVTTLAKAAGGDVLPTLEVTLAYAQACGGGPQYWTEQWLLAQSGALPRPEGSWAAVPPSVSRATSPAAFVEALRQLRLWAGSPSYTRMSALTGLGRSTLADALSCRRGHLPSRDVTSKLVLACMQYAWANRTWLEEAPHIAVTPEQAQRAWMHVWLQLSSQEITRRSPGGRRHATPEPPLQEVTPQPAPTAAPVSATGAAGAAANPGGQGSLRPVEGFSAEAKELAEALQMLFASLNMSARKYAARMHRDASTVSRYLGGRRIPPREFILEMAQAADMRGRPTDKGSLEKLLRLHQAALSSSPSLSDQLSVLAAREEAAVARVRKLEAEIARLRAG
ncbi:helix-turn-helix domain-containing protein [Streptomyces chartreusis]|uniref:Helix-turn-helix transcriptional regulator n=1 Tax=Streptomyces chartreusis TaxID=1969 RepID=A0A7H8T6H6_STRCX|nr:helix-turn-helix transcriptional regulator [Streptomyces chartreusis]QKZ19083.1 helix-turn-helix transcriptional regulator [Streptomyces chartreusis]